MNCTAAMIEQRTLQAYQCDRYGFMRPLILMNELQEMADRHAGALGVGRDFLVQNNVAWVVTHYLVDIVESPVEGEKLSFITWPSIMDGVRTAREFEIRGSDDRILVRATSQWVLLNMETRRPIRLDGNVPNFPRSMTRAWDRTFDKFSDIAPRKTHVFKCRFDDIDVNQHINNAVYAVWATESVGYAYRDEHVLRGIEINFRREINPTTPQVLIDVTIDGNTTYHNIRTDDNVHASVVCRWEKR